MAKKISFMERLQNAVSGRDDADFNSFYEEESDTTIIETGRSLSASGRGGMPDSSDDTPIAVDVYQTDTAIVVKALIAGVTPQNLDITLTRDMITIKGLREPETDLPDDSYFQRELEWGPMSRTILLPEEVDVDAADAAEKHGILVVTLPKVNKARQTKLRVRAR